jgi:glyoxylase-like metal-dependent hydrolase (beta-lactamase superfamily II)
VADLHSIEPAAGRPRARADLSYPFTPPPSDGSVVNVADGILWARMPMPMTLDHINVYLLREDDGWSLIDTGLNTDATRTLWLKIVAEHLDGLPVKRLICTHCHYDHAGVAAWISEYFEVPLLMTAGEYFMLRHFSSPLPEPLPPSQMAFFRLAGMDDAQIEKIFAVLRRDPFMPPIPASYQRLREGQILQIGARSWEVLIGEGHSPEHACLYNASERILIAGDQLLPRISSNVMVGPIEPEANPLQLWLASLRKLDRLAPDTLVLPSHQGVFRGLHARVEELLDHHEQQFELLRAELARGGPATALALTRVQFPKLRHAMDEMMGLGECIAHLAWLRNEGEVSREVADDGSHRFRLNA